MTTWTHPSRPGGIWDYKEAGVTFNEAGYTFNGIGVTTTWTNESKT